MREVPITYLREALDYDPETGALIWKVRPVEHFPREQTARMWNTKFAGKPALTAVMKGYHYGGLAGKNFLQHRVAWALYYGKWSTSQIDHINGDRGDNRILNLREADGLLNCKNMRKQVRNKSGTTGVRWVDASNRWLSRIYVDGRAIHLGVFRNKADAVNARQAADVRYGFHPNHGSARARYPE